MTMCVCERDREKVGDGREKARKSRGGRESIGWERVGVVERVQDTREEV